MKTILRGVQQGYTSYVTRETMLTVSSARKDHYFTKIKVLMDVAFDLHRKPGLMDSQGVVNTAVAFF